MPTTPQPAARSRFVAIHKTATDDYGVGQMSDFDERTSLPKDSDGDVWLETGSYVPTDSVVLVDPAIVEALVDLPTLERTAPWSDGWGRKPTEEEKEGRRMPLLGIPDSHPDDALLADIRTLVAVYLARKNAARRPTSPAHEALERVVRGGASKADGDLVRAALDKAARA